MDLEESLKSSSAEHFYTNDDGTVIPIKRCMNSAVGKANCAIHRIVISSNFLNMFSNWQNPIKVQHFRVKVIFISCEFNIPDLIAF